jgi:tripartite-type tricarboxylate transporter receptor subunit TctC
VIVTFSPGAGGTIGAGEAARADPDGYTQHYHLRFKCTPWGYSCFRGGG